MFFGIHVERGKNGVVDVLLERRGVLQKNVWHGSMIGLSAFGMLTAGVFGNQTALTSSFPGATASDPRFADSYSPVGSDDPVLNSLNDTRTTISQKPRSEIIDYTVQDGDTLSSIADKFNISTDTIKWANNLTDDTIRPGDVLKILPVSGVAHTVKSGDTLQSVAKIYNADSQSILDFPFNDIPNDFQLKIGQVLIVPDGVPPAEQNTQHGTPKPAPKYLAQSPNSNAPSFNAPGGASFIWPTVGALTQYFSWYHPGLDIANNSAPGIVASDAGVVRVAGWLDSYGYGNRVVIDHGNGYTTLYAHMSNIYVTVGQIISKGQVIGQMGSTGRSTGTHCHFEIRYKGIAVNPLSILK